MNSRSVVIDTADGVTVHLPNNDVLNTPLLNYSTRGAHPVRARGRRDPDVGADPESIDGGGPGRGRRRTRGERCAGAGDRPGQPRPAPGCLPAVGLARPGRRGRGPVSRCTAAVYAGLMAAGIERRRVVAPAAAVAASACRGSDLVVHRSRRSERPGSERVAGLEGALGVAGQEPLHP